MMANTIAEHESKLGENLKALRLLQNLDQITLAARAGISVGTLQCQFQACQTPNPVSRRAMYHAKAAGRNTLRFFDLQTQAAVNARGRLEAELREGVREGQFVLHYQAQVMDLSRTNMLSMPNYFFLGDRLTVK